MAQYDAILTLHHGPDLERGLGEFRRTARKRTVILTFETSVGGFWLAYYLPEMVENLRRHLGEVATIDVPIPHDCIDGFWGADWCRPEAYLQDEVQSGISLFSGLKHLESGLERLRLDL